jgi:hypothetical protein
MEQIMYASEFLKVFLSITGQKPWNMFLPITAGWSPAVF